MSWYCYRLPDGEVRDEQFPMGTAPARIRFADGKIGERDHASEWKAHDMELRTSRGWPVESYALGVNPVDGPALARELASKGVPTEVNERGNPLMRNPSHARRVRKACKAFDRDGFFG